MYSISSQIFEGLTEYLMTKSSQEDEQHENRLGPEGSGRLIGDIIKKNSTIEEKKFLHDHSFDLFENKLLKENRILELHYGNIEENLSQIDDFEFVLVKVQALFNDMKIIKHTLGEYNGLVEAITLLQASPELRKKSTQKNAIQKRKGFDKEEKSVDFELSEFMKN
ncbi:hypothetical protein FLX56_24075 [Synechococcus moorigangaii CMS01]|nr:hypothetical protein [Synechococcus moorigangaii CMS01]